MNEFKDLREAIKFAMIERNYSQLSLCKKVGYNQPNFSSWMNKKRLIPGEMLEKILSELKIKFLVK
jgi:transcriptional regulator with XRE-family HTH domain